jgi:hypothetical protein
MTMETVNHARMKAMELWVSACNRAPWTQSDFKEIDRMAAYLLNGSMPEKPQPLAEVA